MIWKGRESEYQKEYRAANLERLRMAAKARYTANREQALARAKKRQTEKAEEVRRYQKSYRAANREKLTDQVRQWCASKPGYRTEKNRRYRAAHPDSERVKLSRRRARKAGNGGSHTAAQWRTLCEAWEWSCAYCGHPVTECSAEQEHKVPIVRGGTDDISNIALSCGPCNKRKGTRTAEEFLARMAA